MIYRATKEGIKTKDFHRLCDQKGKNFGIIKTEAKEGGNVRISGWYTDINFKSPKEYRYE